MNEFLVNLTDEWTKFPSHGNGSLDDYYVKSFNNTLRFCVNSNSKHLRKEYAGIRFGMIVQGQAYVERSGGIEDFCFLHGVPRLSDLLLPIYEKDR